METDRTSRGSSGQGMQEKRRSGIPALIDKTVSSTYEDIMAIIEAKMELLKIDLTEKIAIAGSVLILLVVLLIGIAYLITSIALLVGELAGHAFIGYLCVSLVFLLGFVLFTKVKPGLLKHFIHNILLSANE